MIEWEVPPRVALLEATPRRLIADEHRRPDLERLDDDVAEVLGQCREEQEVVVREQGRDLLVRYRASIVDRHARRKVVDDLLTAPPVRRVVDWPRDRQ